MKAPLSILIAAISLSLPCRADWARDQIGLTALGPQDCSGVVIAYLDTGIDLESPYLQNALWTNPHPTQGDVHGYDFLSGKGEIEDVDGHGTSVAHIIAADTNNPDTTGVCSKAQIMALKINEKGASKIEAIHAALEYAIDKKAQIILMTTGLIVQSGLPPFGLKRQIAKATKNGALFLHAAANLSRVPAQSASHPRELWPILVPDRFHPVRGAISVGGSTSEDLPWLGGFRHPDKVHVAAPAQNIHFINAAREHVVDNGNSLAAGFAAGMAAAIWTAHPTWTAEEVVQALQSTSVKPQAYLREMQSGRLDLTNLMAGQPQKALEIEVTGQRPLEGGTSHPYLAPQETEWTFVQEGASYLRVVFSYIDLGNCFSRTEPTKVVILNGAGEPVQEFVCENRGRQYRLPSVFVEGDKLTVRLEAKENHNLFRPGFNFRFLEWGERK